MFLCFAGRQSGRLRTITSAARTRGYQLHYDVNASLRLTASAPSAAAAAAMVDVCSVPILYALRAEIRAMLLFDSLTPAQNERPVASTDLLSRSNVPLR